MTDQQPGATIEDLRDVIARLHAPAPDGCPWCLVQTHETLANDLKKEAYEILDAAERDDPLALAEELGDALMLVLTQVHAATTSGAFTFDDVVGTIIQKLVRRHPHIFGSVEAETPDAVVRNWQAIKQQEQPAEASILDSIPRALPALLRAEEMQKRAAQVGFDWPDVQGVLAKVHEEVDELAVTERGAHQIEEFGDLVFALVNMARRLEFSAEGALQQASGKFARRFASIESACRARGVRPQDMSLDELDSLWNEAKAVEQAGVTSEAQ